jgi:hypothetical protein
MSGREAMGRVYGLTTYLLQNLLPSIEDPAGQQAGG